MDIVHTEYSVNTEWKEIGFTSPQSAPTNIEEKIRELWQLVSFVLVKLRTFSSLFKKFYFSISTYQNLIIDLKNVINISKRFSLLQFIFFENGKYPT